MKVYNSIQEHDLGIQILEIQRHDLGVQILEISCSANMGKG